MSATIVMAQYRQPQLTIACVQTLRRHHGEQTDVVIVDDGSPPEDVEIVSRAGLGNVELLRRPHRGVTAAWNVGARRSSSDVLIFLNNDVVTTGPWIARLIAPLADRRIAMAGVEQRRERHVRREILDRLPTRHFVAGWCFAVRRDDFEAVDGFRESLRLYFSDTDFQLRMLQRLGLGRESLLAFSGLPLRHLGHATTSRCPLRRLLWQADRLRFERLWRGTPEAVAERCGDAS